MEGYVSQKVLEKRGVASIQIPEQSPKSLLQKKEGLYVWSDFTNNILDKVSDIVPAGEQTVVSWDLVISANDELLEKALPEKHLFSVDEVATLVANLIEKQPKGADGPLLTNGYVNLFYTQDFVVSVSWDADDSEWRVGARGRDVHAWDGGHRVFSPATDA